MGIIEPIAMLVLIAILLVVFYCKGYRDGQETAPTEKVIHFDCTLDEFIAKLKEDNK